MGFVSKLGVSVARVDSWNFRQKVPKFEELRTPPNPFFRPERMFNPIYICLDIFVR